MCIILETAAPTDYCGIYMTTVAKGLLRCDYLLIIADGPERFCVLLRKNP